MRLEENTIGVGPEVAGRRREPVVEQRERDDRLAVPPGIVVARCMVVLVELSLFNQDETACTALRLISLRMG